MASGCCLMWRVSTAVTEVIVTYRDPEKSWSDADFHENVPACFQFSKWTVTTVEDETFRDFQA